ncbi:MAG: hypothetical protein ACYS7Y_04475 [Planctomycetota bacterium]|jgi:hypothetical protein
MTTAIICVREARGCGAYVTYHNLDGDHSHLKDDTPAAYQRLRLEVGISLPDFAAAVRKGANVIEVYIYIGDN